MIHSRSVRPVLLALTFGAAFPAPARGVPSADEAAGALVGFWTVDAEAMGADPRFRETLESPEGQAGIAYTRGVLFEFTSDGSMRAHMGAVDERALTITVDESGAVHVLAPDTNWHLEFVDDNSFVQKFNDSPLEILWTRSWQPLVGAWRVDGAALEEEHWHKSLDADAMTALRPEIDSLLVEIADDGSFRARLGGVDRAGTIRLESTTPAAGALVPEAPGAEAIGHLVRRDESIASLYVGDRSWPLRRANPPSAIVQGTWKFDVERARTFEWLLQAIPEGQTFDQYIAEKVKVDEVVVVTETTWHGQEYTVRDERANQFAVESQQTIVFWVRIIDENHISQMISLGREFPLVRVHDRGAADANDADAPATP